jgi:hypothetical protein
MPLHDLGDPSSHRRLGRCCEATLLVLAGDAVTAEVNDRRAGQDAEQLRVDTRQRTDHPQLPARGREGAVVAFVQGGRARERERRGRRVAAEQVCFSLGRRGVVGVVAGLREEGEHRGRVCSSPREIAGHQPHRGGVDGGVVTAGLGENGVVGLRGERGPRPALRALCGEREILHDARVQRRDVLVADAFEGVILKAPGGLLRRSGAGQRQHRAMLEPEVVGVLGQPALGKIKCRQQLAATLLRLHRLEPVSGRPALGRTARRLLRGWRHGRRL